MNSVDEINNEKGSGFATQVILLLFASLALCGCLLISSGDDQLAVATLMAGVNYLAIAACYRSVRKAQRVGFPSIFWGFALIYFFFFYFRTLYVVFAGDDQLVGILGISNPNHWLALSLIWSTISINLFVVAGNFASEKNGLVKFLDNILLSWITKMRAEGESHSIPALFVFLGIQAIITYLLVQQVIGFAMQGLRLTEVTDSAYLYMLPVVTHGIDLYIFGAIMSYDGKSKIIKYLLAITSLALAVVKALVIREITLFRSVTFAGLLCMLLTVFIHRIRLWHILTGFLLLTPVIGVMGTLRTIKYEYFATEFLRRVNDLSIGTIFSPFSSDGDYTVLDIFASALFHDQSWHPYGLSIAYVLVHWVPRSIWPDKPPNGILTDDASYLTTVSGYQLPYYPGLSGTFYVEGGIVFMLVAMFIFGWFLKSLDNAFVNLEAGARYRQGIAAVFCVFFVYSMHAVRMVPYQYVYGVLIILLGYGLMNAVGRLFIRKERRAGREIDVVNFQEGSR